MRTMTAFALGAMALALVANCVVAGTTRHVSAGAPPGGDGSEANPFNTIQAGINVAVATDIVLVQSGIYPEHIDFLGKSITVCSTNPDSPAVVAVTVIDGMDAGPIVKFVSGEGAGAVLEGFTIRNGRWNSVQTTGTGGIFVLNSSPTIRKNVITGNHSNADGAGIAILGNASPVVLSNVISGNTADGWGGGIFCYGDQGLATPEIAGNRIWGNECYWDGGGICSFESATVVIRNNVLHDNVAGEVGGGIMVFYDVLATINNNTVAGNRALGTDAPDATRYGRGGGVACQHSGMGTKIDSCIIWSNSAENSEGDQISLETSAYLSIDYSNVQSGQAAIFIDGSSPPPALSYGSHNLAMDPLFFRPDGAAAEKDFHLKSRMGRFDPVTGTFALGQDAVSSPCIDRGNSAFSYTNEPKPHGYRVNMGAYGNTADASMSGYPLMVVASLDNGWVYQNTASTTLDRHRDLLQVSVVDDPFGNSSFTATVTKTGGTGEITVSGGPSSLAKYLYGGRRSDGVAGTGTCQFLVTVTGDQEGGAGWATKSVNVRRLGDISRDGAVNTDDAVQLVKKLNNMNVAPLQPWDFDLDGDGAATTDDDVLLAKILNNLAIP